MDGNFRIISLFKTKKERITIDDMFHMLKNNKNYLNFSQIQNIVESLDFLIENEVVLIGGNELWLNIQK